MPQTFKRAIKQGINRGEFKLYYQPIVNLATNEIAGHEALIRWHHPTDDLLMPSDFIPMAECDPFLMVEICEFVIKQSWRDRQKLSNGFISVNIAPSSLEMRRFWDVLDDCALVSDRPVLFLEITERLLAQYKIVAPYWTNKQRAVGAFIDDLGVGESSYVQVAEILKWFPSNDFVKVKLDIAFAQNLKDATYQWFAKSIIDSMHNCPTGRIEVIAEGIEHQWQRSLFHEWGCDYGQGWLWGKAEQIAVK
jgi:EAL domain-containing protein (putative c-di-GMP-specific phosphodiesterase class I)